MVGERQAAYREGYTLSVEAVVRLTGEVLTDVERAIDQEHQLQGGHEDLVTGQRRTPTPPSHSPLSEREQAVLARVAQGLSSKAIGQQLFIAPSTVNYHLTSIFNKLGVSTRAQVVAVAAKRGLL
jgi:DNA-binding NarL/FixJ family response regulator